MKQPMNSISFLPRITQFKSGTPTDLKKPIITRIWHTFRVIYIKAFFNIVLYIYNMSSTIRISIKDKQLLEQLIRYLNFHNNCKLTQEQMISLLVQSGMQQKDKLLSNTTSNQKSNDSWKDDPIFSMKEIDLGNDTSESIDKILYGDSR